MNTASPAPTMTKENSLENCFLKPNLASSNQEVVNEFLNYKKQQDDKKFVQNIKSNFKMKSEMQEQEQN